MLYLFNSAFRPLYLKNVLNTLSLPTGWTNEYRYRGTGEPRYVPPEVYSQLPALPAGTECVISFIDRFGAGGDEYHPLRRGKYLSHREEDGNIFFRIELGAFLYPRNPKVFRQHIVQALASHGLPKLTDGNAECTSDGAYVALTGDIFAPVQDYVTGEEAWTDAVERLAATRAFATTAADSHVFCRLDLHKSSAKRNRVSPVLRDDSSVYVLEKDIPYELSVTFRFPRQRTDTSAKAYVQISWGDNIRPLGSAVLNFDSYANSVSAPFISKRYLEDSSGSISFAPRDEPGQPKLFMFDRSLQYEVSESALFWVQAVMALLLFSTAGAFIGVDLSKILPFSFGGLISAAWPKFLAGIIQAAALFWVFRLVGNKFL